MKKKHSGEGKHPDVALGEGLEIGSVHTAHKKGLVNGLGNGKQGQEWAPAGEGSQETRRYGKKPQPVKVNNTPSLDKSVRDKAFNFTKRSQEGGAEKEGGW